MNPERSRRDMSDHRAQSRCSSEVGIEFIPLISGYMHLPLLALKMFYHKNSPIYFVYILLCKDESYYRGLTDDIDQRYYHHHHGEYPSCHTYLRRAVQLIYSETLILLEDGLKREEQIKKWSRAKKKALTEANYHKLQLLAHCSNFTHVKFREFRENK